MKQTFTVPLLFLFDAFSNPQVVFPFGLICSGVYGSCHKGIVCVNERVALLRLAYIWSCSSSWIRVELVRNKVLWFRSMHRVILERLVQIKFIGRHLASTVFAHDIRQTNPKDVYWSWFGIWSKIQILQMAFILQMGQTKILDRMPFLPFIQPSGCSSSKGGSESCSLSLLKMAYRGAESISRQIYTLMATGFWCLLHVPYP